jgi:hypothetical protein
MARAARKKNEIEQMKGKIFNSFCPFLRLLEATFNRASVATLTNEFLVD